MLYATASGLVRKDRQVRWNYYSAADCHVTKSEAIAVKPSLDGLSALQAAADKSAGLSLQGFGRATQSL